MQLIEITSLICVGSDSVADFSVCFPCFDWISYQLDRARIKFFLCWELGWGQRAIHKLSKHLYLFISFLTWFILLRYIFVPDRLVLFPNAITLAQRRVDNKESKLLSSRLFLNKVTGVFDASKLRSQKMGHYTKDLILFNSISHTGQYWFCRPQTQIFIFFHSKYLWASLLPNDPDRGSGCCPFYCILAYICDPVRCLCNMSGCDLFCTSSTKFYIHFLGTIKCIVESGPYKITVGMFDLLGPCFFAWGYFSTIRQAKTLQTTRNPCIYCLSLGLPQHMHENANPPIFQATHPCC